uniref:RNA helicase n=1 Tax=Acrobeloides nanus TaxID=290746 RepID=A0A914C472_9BILA
MSAPVENSLNNLHIGELIAKPRGVFNKRRQIQTVSPVSEYSTDSNASNGYSFEEELIIGNHKQKLATNSEIVEGFALEIQTKGKLEAVVPCNDFGDPIVTMGDKLSTSPKYEKIKPQHGFNTRIRNNLEASKLCEEKLDRPSNESSSQIEDHNLEAAEICENLHSSLLLSKPVIPMADEEKPSSATMENKTQTFSNAENSIPVLSRQGSSTQIVENNNVTAEICENPRSILPRIDVYHKSKKFIPLKKMDSELFSGSTNIESGPDFDKIFELDIEITGGDGKKIVFYDTFEECNFERPIMKSIENKKYARLTPIQRSVIPIIQKENNFDLLGKAQTGCGKSAAFLLPIIDAISKLKAAKNDGLNEDSPYALVLSPTRELAQQLFDDAKAFSVGTEVKVVAAYGEYDIGTNIQDIQRGCDIICATMGRLLDFIENGRIKLNRLNYLVLDEADLFLLDTNQRQKESFYKDLVLLNGSMGMNTRKRTFMFSATFSDEVLTMAEEFLEPGYFSVIVGGSISASMGVEQAFIQVGQYDKMPLLMELLQTNFTTYHKGTADGKSKEVKIVPKTLVFVERKIQSDRIAIALSLTGIKALSLNADRTQAQRQFALEQFIKGDINVLVATGVAAHGLNIPDLQHVINFDLPKERETYIHRIGRTGRAGNRGVATSFIDPRKEDDCKLAKELIKILEEVGQNVPEFLRELASF